MSSARADQPDAADPEEPIVMTLVDQNPDTRSDSDTRRTEPDAAELAQLLRELADVAADSSHDLGTALYYFDDERRRAGHPELTGTVRVRIIRAVRASLPGLSRGDWRADLRAVNDELDVRRKALGHAQAACTAVLPQLLRAAADLLAGPPPDPTPKEDTRDV